MSALKPKPSQIRGFTLVELLVVITIIAMLVSLLLPVLGQAKAAAKSVQCLAQERQSGVAMFSYISDNNEYWLINSYPFCGHAYHYNALWSAVVAHYSNFVYITEYPSNSTIYPKEAKFTSYTEPNKPKTILKCPSDTSRNTWGGPMSVSYGYNGTVYGLGVNDFFTDSDDMVDWYGVNAHWFKDYYGRVRTPQVKKVADTVMIADEYSPGGYEYSGYHLQWTTVDYRHAGAITNILWADGHASGRKVTEMSASDYDRR